MNKQQIESFFPLALAVRRLFHKLAHGVDVLHQDSDMSAGMRAVLESVIDGGPQTVPHMAKLRSVSRQHIQGLVNALQDAGLVETIANPAHRRSNLVGATPHGAKIFAGMRATEIDALRRMPIDASPEELEAATKVLCALIATFEGADWLTATRQIEHPSADTER